MKANLLSFFLLKLMLVASGEIIVIKKQFMIIGFQISSLASLFLVKWLLVGWNRFILKGHPWDLLLYGNEELAATKDIRSLIAVSIGCQVIERVTRQYALCLDFIFWVSYFRRVVMNLFREVLYRQDLFFLCSLLVLYLT